MPLLLVFSRYNRVSKLNCELFNTNNKGMSK